MIMILIMTQYKDDSRRHDDSDHDSDHADRADDCAG